MIIYCVLIALVTIFALTAEHLLKTVSAPAIQKRQLLTNKKYDKTLICLIFLCIAFVAAFRYDVGVDFHSYYNIQQWASAFQRGNYTDPGFSLLAMFCQWLLPNQKGALIIISAIITVALFVFTIAKRGESLSMSIILFFFVGCFTGMFNGVRQFLAAAILFAGYPLIIKKKFWKWLIVVSLAATIHITSILMLFAYFICNLKCDWRLVVLYALIAVVLLFLYEPLFDLVGAMKQTEIDSELAYMSSSVNILRVAVQCVPLLMFLFIDKDKVNEDAECRFLFNICLLNAAIAVASMNSAYFSRFSIYMFPF